MLKDIPWNIFRDVALFIRKQLGEEKLPPDIIVPNVSASELRDDFRRIHFDDNNITAHYYNEDYSMARPEFKDDDWEYYQTHIRIWEVREEAGVPYCEIQAHHELDPTIDGYAKPHLKGVNYSHEAGLEKTKTALESLGISYNSIK